jgi:hypothetical protein
MTDVLDALLGLLLFNVCLGLILLARCLFDDRRKRARRRGATRRSPPYRGPQSRVRLGEPFAGAFEERRAALSPRRVKPRD